MIKWLKRLFGDFSLSKPEEIKKPKRKYTRLTVGLKATIIGYNKNGFSTRDIANRLDISENSVRRTLKEYNEQQ